jgi:hypothetical protein
MAPAERAFPEPAVKAHRADTRRGQWWAIAAGGGAIATVLALVSFTQFDRTVQTPAHASAGAHPVLPALSAAAPVLAQDPAGGTARNLPAIPTIDLAGSAASGASSGGMTASSSDGDQRTAMTRVAPAKPPAVSARAAKAPQVNREATANAQALAPDTVTGLASYQLQIKPWGNVFVDGADRGASPPLRRLVLQPGPHTVRITHPHYRDSILEFESASTTSNGKIIVDFNREAQ